MSAARVVAVVLAGLALATPLALRGQALTPDSFTTVERVAPARPLLTCLGCASQKHFAMAVGEVFGDEMIPYTMNRWIKHKPWAQTSWQSWGDNLRNGWEWDTDHFITNQFAHPYSGNLFFSAARSNGFGFWGAAPFALSGSALWEYFGERYRPSINDLANTTLGGITLGEVSYRLSAALVDHQATGSARTFSEIGAALLNPVGAFSRLLHGDIGRVEPNAPDRLPSAMHGGLALGYQRIDVGPKNAAVRGPSQAFTFLTLAYGDPLAGDVTHPFGAFLVEASLAAPGTGPISQLRVGGALTTHDLDLNPRHRQQLLVAMHYHYYNNAAFESGGQGFSAAWLSRYQMGEHNSLSTEVWLTGFALAAIKSDFGPDSTSIADEKARNYDYGPGAGTRLLARYTHGNRWFLDIGYQGFWIDVLSGTADYHYYHTLGSTLQIRVLGHLAVGDRDFLYFRTSHYSSHPTTHTRDYQVQGYLAWVF